MAFNLTRREGEALRVSGVLIEISRIKDNSVILRITAPESVRVCYKEFSRNAKSGCESAQDGAALLADLELGPIRDCELDPASIVAADVDPAEQPE